MATTYLVRQATEERRAGAESQKKGNCWHRPRAGKRQLLQSFASRMRRKSCALHIATGKMRKTRYRTPS